MNVNNDVKNVVDFCEKVSSKGILRGCSEGQLKKIASYIENTFIPLINKKSHDAHYITRKESKLDGSLEYDPKSKKTFIHFKNEKVGEGYHKEGTYSLLYDPKKPKACIRLVLKASKPKKKLAKKYSSEAGRSQKLQHKARHIAKTIAVTKHTEGGIEKKAMIQKFYANGTLGSLMSKSPHVLTTERKVKIARGAIKGLQELHAKGYLHRDLHAGNILVGKDFKSCLSDFGRAIREDKMTKNRTQAILQKIAPELFCLKHPKTEDYKRGELFSLGLNLYELAYDKPLYGADEQETKKVFKNLSSTSSLSTKKKEVKSLCKKIEAIIRDEKAGLETKNQLSLDERLRYAVLGLLEPEAKKRKSADHWIQFLKRT